MPLHKLTVVKDTEQYVFIYDDDSQNTLLQILGCYAADQTRSFSWYDAAVLLEQIEARAGESHGLDHQPPRRFEC
jgi:hypothetical protein